MATQVDVSDDGPDSMPTISLTCLTVLRGQMLPALRRGVASACRWPGHRRGSRWMMSVAASPARGSRVFLLLSGHARGGGVNIRLVEDDARSPISLVEECARRLAGQHRDGRRGGAGDAGYVAIRRRRAGPDAPGISGIEVCRRIRARQDRDADPDVSASVMWKIVYPAANLRRRLPRQTVRFQRTAGSGPGAHSTHGGHVR